MKVQIRLLNDYKCPESMKKSVKTCSMSMENANRVFDFLAEILRKEDEKYIKVYKKLTVGY